MVNESGNTRVYSVNVWLRRLSRVSAFALLVVVVVQVVSGWGITQTGIIYHITFGLIDRRIADTIHRWINMPLAFFFLSHVMINIRLTIFRNHFFRVWLVDGILILIGSGLMAIVIYMERFRLGG